MENTIKNDSHYTDGYYYRIPGEPQLISALGRALWNFLYIEETVVAIVWEAGKEMSPVRSEMAGGKEHHLTALKAEFQKANAPSDLLTAIENAIKAFNVARSEYRNALAHAVPYTVFMEEDGKFQPGLRMKGKYVEHDVQNSKDMHTIAQNIEQTVNPLNEARFAVIRYMESLGRSRQTNTP